VIRRPTYIRFEILRTLRNWRFMIFSLAFPLVLFITVAASNRNAQLGGISLPLYYMTGMAAWGTMSAVIAGGSRIGAERSVGWTRQMRTTPLSSGVYFATKVLCGYLLALLSIACLYIAGISLGVRLSGEEWLTMTALILIGLIPFAVLGILLGHVLTVDSMGPAMGGITALLALFGGAWGPFATSGALHTFVQLLPSYWLVQAGATALGGGGWPLKAWIVMIVWTAVLVWVSTRVYQRDTARV